MDLKGRLFYLVRIQEQWVRVRFNNNVEKFYMLLTLI
jgi:hypothetical protein